MPEAPYHDGMRVGDIVSRYYEVPEYIHSTWMCPIPFGYPGVIIKMDETYDTRPKWVEVRWMDGRYERIEERPETPEECSLLVAEVITVITPQFWVNVYLHDRVCGGPADGGDWYDAWDPVEEECVYCRSEEEAERVLAEKEAWCKQENSERRSDIGSVLSEGRYEVRREAWPAEPRPCGAYHYE